MTGNYNFFNLLTLTLCLSLLDDQHVNYWLRKSAKTSDNGTVKLQGLNTRSISPFCHHRTPYVPCSESKPLSSLCYLLELLVWALLILGTIVCFDLQLDTSKKVVSSRTGVCLCVCVCFKIYVIRSTCFVYFFCLPALDSFQICLYIYIIYIKYTHTQTYNNLIFLTYPGSIHLPPV